MKSFLGTKKGKTVSGIVTAVIIAAVIIAFLMANRGYRSIAVEALNGTTKVTNDQESQEAYVGQHLVSGDDVEVTAASDLTLALDADKYVYAKENTHFWIEALGKKNSTRTTIKLANGSTLCRIDNKLKDEENFEVETPNAAMAVRGTVYKVETFLASSGETFTIVDVFEGTVFVQVKMESGENTDESRTLSAGERAIIHSSKDFSEFIKEQDADILEKEGIGTADEEFGKVIYSSLTKEEALFLGKAIDEGRILSIGKELLYDIVGLTPHKFSSKSEIVEPTCTVDGYYYEICSICGVQGEMVVLEALGHQTEGKDDVLCKICGKEIDDLQISEENQKEEEEDNPCKEGHEYKQVVVAATCTTDGYTEDQCAVCGEKQNHVVMPATGHNMVYSKVEQTCTEDGYESNICSVCGEGTTTKLPLWGHDFVAEHTEPTCTSDGIDSVICRRCGAGSIDSIPAKGHSESGGAVSDGLSSHHYSCGNCGETIRSEGHSWVDNGMGSMYCSACGQAP